MINKKEIADVLVTVATLGFFEDIIGKERFVQLISQMWIPAEQLIEHLRISNGDRRI